jgi:hypothetical protein
MNRILHYLKKIKHNSFINKNIYKYKNQPSKLNTYNLSYKLPYLNYKLQHRKYSTMNNTIHFNNNQKPPHKNNKFYLFLVLSLGTFYNIKKKNI